MSGVTLLAGYFGALTWLDILMFRIVAAGAPKERVISMAADHPVSIVDINREEYERWFRGSSPLDRNVLARIIGEIARKRRIEPSMDPVAPRVLAIDIQLDPPADACTHAAPDSDVNAALINALKIGVSVVLADPAENRADLRATSDCWRESIRRQVPEDPNLPNRPGTLEFASAAVHENFGTAVRASHDNRSLEREALHAVRASHPDSDSSNAPTVSPDPYASDPYLDPASLDDANVLAISWTTGGSEDRGSARDSGDTSNPAASGGAAAQTMGNRGVEREIRLVPPAGLTQSYFKESIVLLGGSFDDCDKYLTVVDEKARSGLLIHAASLQILSRSGRGAAITYWLTYLGELLVGIWLSSLWERAWIRLHGVSSAHSRGWYWSAFGANWAMLIGYLACVAIPAFFVMLGAAQTVRYASWINPGPLLIGLIIDAIRRTGASESPTAHPAWRHKPFDTDGRKYVQSLLAVAGLFLLLFGQR